MSSAPFPIASLEWRPLLASDLAALVKVAEKVHPAFPEDDAVFAERMALAPGWCFALSDEKRLYGYVLSHPWREGPPPKLNSLLGALPAPAPVAYIHDLALLPETRGAGHGDAIVKRLILQAQSSGHQAMGLVAVAGSAPFWARHGFRPAASAASLASYGADACPMRLDLAR